MNHNIPDAAFTKAESLVRSTQICVIAGLFPVIGQMFIFHLVQWYRLRNHFPVLVTGTDSKLKGEFRAALPKLWFAILFWPLLITLLAMTTWL